MKNYIEETKFMETNNTQLSNFVKENITFEEKIRLIIDWEEDRASDGEYIYDLDDACDAWTWVDLYGIEILYKCRNIGRYWMGGWQFSCFGKNTDGNCATAWCVNEESIANFFSDNNLLGEIADRFENWMMANEGFSEDRSIGEFSIMYSNLIDFKSYYKAKKVTRYKWVAISSDYAFEDECVGCYDTIEDCYNNMRSYALEKMKWNTEYGDIHNDNTYDDSTFIKYEVEFHKDMIIHSSYSGTYMYKIIPANIIFDKAFKDAFHSEARNYAMKHHYSC